MTQEIAQKLANITAAQLRALRIPLWFGVLLVIVQVSWLTFSHLQNPTLASATTPPQLEQPTQPDPSATTIETVGSPTDQQNVGIENLNPSDADPATPTADLQSPLAAISDNEIIESVSAALVESLFKLTRPAEDFGITVELNPSTTDPENADPNVGSNGDEPSSLVASTDVPKPPVVEDGPASNVLVLFNAQERAGTISFLVDRTVYSLAPGESHQFDNDAKRVIRFHRGGEFGKELREVTSGTYHFKATSNGWTLAEKP